MIADECAAVAAKIRARHAECTDCRNAEITTEDVIEVVYAWKRK
jgi:hypothetical protein